MKLIAALLLLLLVSATPAQESKKHEFEVPSKSKLESASPICEFPSLQLPADLRIYAAGGYSGRERKFQIDQSGHTATQFDIVVNSPKQSVALLLGAYEPTIWNIGWTKGTKIVAVLVSGYHRQAVAGLDSTVPVLNSSYDNKGSCGYFYVDNAQNSALNPMSRKLFNKPVNLVFPGDQSGKIVIGEPIAAGTTVVTSAARTPESFRDQNAPLAGKAGIEDAIAKGLLRLASRSDADAWVAAVIANSPKPDTPPIAGQGIPKPPKPSVHDAYVVLKQFAYPAGLYGGNSVTFLILAGVPKPTGNPGHSAIYDFNSLRCQGPGC